MSDTPLNDNHAYGHRLKITRLIGLLTLANLCQLYQCSCAKSGCISNQYIPHSTEYYSNIAAKLQYINNITYYSKILQKYY